MVRLALGLAVMIATACGGGSGSAPTQPLALTTAAGEKLPLEGCLDLVVPGRSPAEPARLWLAFVLGDGPRRTVSVTIVIEPYAGRVSYRVSPDANGGWLFYFTPVPVGGAPRPQGNIDLEPGRSGNLDLAVAGWPDAGGTSRLAGRWQCPVRGGLRGAATAPP